MRLVEMHMISMNYKNVISFVVNFKLFMILISKWNAGSISKIQQCRSKLKKSNNFVRISSKQVCNINAEIGLACYANIYTV